MAIKTVGVLGCGLMGAGIAQVSAAAGFKTIVLEVNEDVLKKGLGRIEKFLTDGVAKGKVTEDAKKTTLGNLSGTTKYADLKDCDLVIEAIIENVEVKKQAYAQVEAVVGPHCLIASNTSSLCITELGAGTKRPDKVGGLHFFNPVPLMKLVEVIRALATSQETHDALMGFARAIGKEPISAPDRGGFIVNRLLVPYLLDAIRCLEEGLGTVQDIDNGMKLGCGYPMGPFTLLDFVGLDTTYFKVPGLFGGSNKKSEEHLRKSLSYNPNSIISHIFLAETLEDMGRKDDARKEAQAALDAPLDPNWTPEDKRFKEQAKRLIQKLR